MNLLIDLIPYGLGAIFLIAIMLGYKDWKKYKRIEELNERFYSRPPAERK